MYLDVPFPEYITIKDNVCITTGVTIISHFDPSIGIKNHPIKKYKKRVLLEEGVFVGPRAIILPGVTLKKNTFIQAGTVITKSTNENSIVSGNPQKREKKIDISNYIKNKYTK
jgi:maltose O-acetyltransferase